MRVASLLSAVCGLLLLSMLVGCGPDESASQAEQGADVGGGASVRALPELSLPETVPPAALRRVIPLLPDPTNALTPAVFEQRFDPPLVLGAGEVSVQPLALDVGGPQLVQVEWSGAAPRVLAGPAGSDERVPLRRLPGPPVAGLLQATLRVPWRLGELELRGVPEGAEVQRLVVRPWGSTPAGEGGGAHDGVVRRLGVMQDHRPGLMLAAGSSTRLHVELPQQATRLALAVAHDPAVAVTEPVVAGLELLVSAVDLVDEQPLLARRVPLPTTRARWGEVQLDVRALAGRSVKLRLAAHGPEGSALALATPELHCEVGARRSNLVLVSLDTTRRDHLSAYGYARATTPQLQALAARGALFERATASSSWTLPSHATMLSGTWAETHGVEHPAQALDMANTPWLAAQLREAGWATRAFTGGGYLNAAYGFAHGFAAFSDNDPVFDASLPGVRKLAASVAGAALIEAHEAQDFQTAIDWLGDHAELPFFLFVQTFAVHDYRPTGEFATRFAGEYSEPPVVPLRSRAEQLERPYSADELRQLVDLYDGALAQVDDLLGQLFARLDDLGLREHTYVVVTADHGETLGEHELRGTPVVGHAQGLWDELLAVPLIVAGPGLEPRRLSERVSLVDLAPTLLELLEQPVPDAMQGRSLLPLLQGRRQGFVPSPVLAGVHSQISWQHALHQGPYKLVLGDPDAKVTHPLDPPVQLYDLREDPGETTSLHEREAARAADLRGALQALRADLIARRQGEGITAELDEEVLRQLRELGYAGDG